MRAFALRFVAGLLVVAGAAWWFGNDDSQATGVVVPAPADALDCPSSEGIVEQWFTDDNGRVLADDPADLFGVHPLLLTGLETAEGSSCRSPSPSVCCARSGATTRASSSTSGR